MFAFFWRSYLYHFTNHISSELSGVKELHGVFIDVTGIVIGTDFPILKLFKSTQMKYLWMRMGKTFNQQLSSSYSSLSSSFLSSLPSTFFPYSASPSPSFLLSAQATILLGPHFDKEI